MKLIGQNKTQKGADIDLGLAILNARRKPGARMPLWLIAAFAGVTSQRIQQLEAKALANLRAKLGECPELMEELTAILESDRRTAQKTGVTVH